MTDKLENFRSLLVSNQLMFDPKIEFLGQGEGNENYLAVEGGLKYVLRVPRQDISDIRDLYNEHIQLKFLESNDIDFAPRSIFYDKETGTNIISHVEGHDTSVAKLPMKMITDFVNNLILLDNLTFSNYKDFCKENNYPCKTPQTAQELFRKIGTEWYEIIKRFSEDDYVKELIEWIEPKMEYIENEVENRGTETMYFHGDLRWHPGGGNIKINNEQINFIDWESAGFGEYNHVEIGDVSASIPDPENNKKRIEMIINEYVSNKERSKTQIMDQITFTLKYSKLTDLLWSAQKYLLMKQKGEPEWKKYKEMTEYRMQAGEVFYKDGFIKQFLNFVT